MLNIYIYTHLNDNEMEQVNLLMFFHGSFFVGNSDDDG